MIGVAGRSEPSQGSLLLLLACLSGLLICSSLAGRGPSLWRRNFCYTVPSYENGVWVSDLSVGSGSGPWSETRSVSSGSQTAPSSVACWTESACLGDGHGFEVVPREAVMVTMVRA